MVIRGHDRWATEQVASLIHRSFDLRYATLEETINEHVAINDDTGYTLEKSIPGQTNNWLRYEGLMLASDHFAVAVALALLWWTDETHSYAATVSDAEAIVRRIDAAPAAEHPEVCSGHPAYLVRMIAPQYAGAVDG